jgi:hypothetical protein
MDGNRLLYQLKFFQETALRSSSRHSSSETCADLSTFEQCLVDIPISVMYQCPPLGIGQEAAGFWGSEVLAAGDLISQVRNKVF